MPSSVIVAGSTERTLICAKALSEDPRFEVGGVLTPSPKPIGRKQILTKNPLHQWAETNGLPCLLIDKKIDQDVQAAIQTSFSSVDFLLVVDFGYIVPQWLLDIPHIAPVNIHPSVLPNYRGSSPGQFALAFGERTSAVSVIVMDAKLDHGPLITKIPFEMNPTWTASDYYAYAFSHISHQLPDILSGYSQNRHATVQPDISPTPTARMLTRDDGFVPTSILNRLVSNWDQTSGNESEEATIPFHAQYGIESTPKSLFNLWRGLTPWPGLWTTIGTQETAKRVKLLSFRYENEQLFLDSVQIEGKTPEKYPFKA